MVPLPCQRTPSREARTNQQRRKPTPLSTFLTSKTRGHPSITHCIHPLIPHNRQYQESSAEYYIPTFQLALGAFLPTHLCNTNWPTANMRNVFVVLFFLPAIALANPNVLLSEFFEPLLETPAQGNDTIAEGSLELVKRQNGCATGYASCSNIGAPGLCCRTSQVCSADAAGHVACCPLNNACTGTIGAIPSATVVATTTAGGVVVIIPGATTTTATGTGGFSQQTGSASRSTVPNSFYPFAFIATTYTNAAACSSAYTSCQTDAASCTADLASGRMGVTISAPNGGATITAIPSIGAAAATSVCQSLSSLACYGLQVEACGNFGNGGTGAGRRRCGDMYAMGAGVAVGIAGQMLR